MATKKKVAVRRRPPRKAVTTNGAHTEPTIAPVAAPTAAAAPGPTTRVTIWGQDPLSPPGLVEIDIPAADLDHGPKDSQFVVVDQDTSSGVVYEPAIFRRETNSFERYEPDDTRFHQINAFAVARHALDMIEAAIGRQVHWAFGPQLAIHPHYLQDRNAFYSRDLGALAFFYFDIPFRQGKVFTALSHDVVAHELGHAALDGLKPRYLEAFHNETGAFHESFGDFTAMFSALALPAVVAQVIAATGGDLRRENIAALLAEEFGFGIYGPGHFFLRNAGDPMTYDAVPSYEVHAFSVLMTATMYEILTEFYEANRGQFYLVSGTNGDGLRLRLEPSTSAPALALLPEGARVKHLGPQSNDGTRTWLRVSHPLFGEGWAAGDYLRADGQPLSDAEALMEATRHLRRIAYRGINYLPPTSVTFRRYGQAMVAADRRAFPADDRGYRQIIKRVFTRRRIVQNPDELETWPQFPLFWDGATDQRGLYQFIYRNREPLGIPSDPATRLNYPAAQAIDLSWVTSSGAAPIRETIVEYSYSQEIRVMGFCSYFVHFGGTLVFDEEGRLVSHLAEPETPNGQGQMVDQGLAFYEALKQRGEIKALTWRRLEQRPTEAAYLLYRLPDGSGQLRLNLCSRFSARSLDLPHRRVVRVELPETDSDPPPG